MVGIVLSRSISCALVALLCFPALAVDTGKLRIVCKPGIRLYLDDQIAGVTTEQDGGLLVHEVSPGIHKVRGEDFEFIPLEFAVSVRAGETTEIKIGNDGAPMVLIPAGEFRMGSNVDAIYYNINGIVLKKHSSEKPIHPVYVDAFYMDEYEVTNALYKKFVDANPRWGKDRIESRYHDGGYLKDWSGNEYPSGKADHPVASVSWYAANAYAKWVGKRLPRETEWERAARGGLKDKKYPWGDNISEWLGIRFPTEDEWKKSKSGLAGKKYPWGDNLNDANYMGTGGKDKWSGTSPVGSFLPNNYGLYDMAGNVFEWCEDWYGDYSSSRQNNPTGLNSGTRRVVRGGSWCANAFTLRCAYRYGGLTRYTYNDLGFRCVAQD